MKRLFILIVLLSSLVRLGAQNKVPFDEQSMGEQNGEDSTRVNSDNTILFSSGMTQNLPLPNLPPTPDARGIKISYDYDNLGRLTLVTDHQSKIIKTYSYNYGN